MSGILLSLVAAPLAAGFVTLPLPARLATLARWITLLCAVYTVGVAGWLVAQPGTLIEMWPLGPSVNWDLSLIANGVSSALLLLTAVVYATAVTTSWRRVKTGVAPFHALLSLLVAGVFGVFLTDHLLYFFVFYELSVLPMYLLIGIWGSTKQIPGEGPFRRLFEDFSIGTRGYGALKLTLYLLVGSAALLIGIFLLYASYERSFGVGTFRLDELARTPLDGSLRLTIFLLFYAGFGSLAGIWPFHTWSPDGHAAAPPAASMMHAGVLMKLGAYGVFRVGMIALPAAATEWGWIVGTIAVINILYGAFAALWQTDIKYLIAYSSVSHMGVVMLGLATLNQTGWSGAVLQMVAHGLMTALFFTLVGIVYEETHEREIGKLRGLGRRMPALSVVWMIAVLSSLGLPGLGGFIAELYTFVGAWQAQIVWAIAGAVGAWLTSLYLLRVARTMLFRGPYEGPGKDLYGIEWVTPIVLAGSLILLGIWPRLLIDRIEPQIEQWLRLMGITS